MTQTLKYAKSLGAWPRALYVEPTTRCNLACVMCMKQTPGCVMVEADLAPATFAALESAFPHLETLIFSGIGEPLLHPELPAFAARARRAMPEGAFIGIQSNGLLLTGALARDLDRAEVSSVCVSVDSCTPETFRQVRKGGSLEGTERAVAALAAAREASGSALRIGLQTTLLAATVDGLPALVEWAAARGVDYILASQLLPYDASMRADSVFGSVSDRTLAFFERWKERAAAQGLDLAAYKRTFDAYAPDASTTALAALLKEMAAEARAVGVGMHLGRMLAEDRTQIARVEQVFDAAQRAARAHGMTLVLPAAMPRHERECRFLEQGAAFVDARGEVSPCSFLWHAYACCLDGAEKRVSMVGFGNVAQTPLADIWSSPDYVRFRRQAASDEYSRCSGCAAGPCASTSEAGGELFQDCHGFEVPCGHCPWCSGGYLCLQGPVPAPEGSESA